MDPSLRNSISQYHRNAIETGSIDCYCLACEQHLRSKADAYYHMKLPIHAKNLQSLPYLASYQGDLIRKVKTGYYCEFCNKRLPTLPIVRLHIADYEHCNIKGNVTIRRVGDVISAPGNLIIKEMAWNGFKDQTCALCSTEYLDIDMHRSDKIHALNLIEKHVRFDRNNNAYRQIDDVSFHCLTCNALYISSDLNDHFSSVEHKDSYAKCVNLDMQDKTINEYPKLVENIKDTFSDISSWEYEDADDGLAISPVPETQFLNPKADGISFYETYNKTQTKNRTKEFHNNNSYDKTRDTSEVVTNEICTNIISKENNEGSNRINGSHYDSSDEEYDTNNLEVYTNIAKIFDNLQEYQKNGVNVNFEYETAFCKICFEHLDLVADVIKNHIMNHACRGAHELTYPLIQTHEKTDINYEKKSFHKEKMIGDNIGNNSESISDSENDSESLKPKKNTENNENIGVEKEDYARNNKITYNKGVGQAYCRICETRLPSTLRSMQEHVIGARHKKASDDASKPQPMPKKYLKLFIESIFIIETIPILETLSMFGTQEIVVNEKYCISKQSYHIISDIKFGYRCNVCQVILHLHPFENWVSHTEGSLHKHNLLNTNVLWSLNTEFIREIQGDILHCGFCNLIIGGYDKLPDHLNSTIHKETATRCKQRLQEHMPDIEN